METTSRLTISNVLKKRLLPSYFKIREFFPTCSPALYHFENLLCIQGWISDSATGGSGLGPHTIKVLQTLFLAESVK